MAFAQDYIDVAERLRELKAKHPEASMQGSYELVTVDSGTFVVYRAECYRTPEDPRPGVGYAWEPVPGKTNFTRDSELMNAETSAWGRAIVAALAAETKRVASADEVRGRQEPPQSQARVQKLRSRASALVADNVSVADAAKEVGLPKISQCTDAQLDRYDALLTDLEAALAAPFAGAK